jgi:hypothetical protein
VPLDYSEKIYSGVLNGNKVSYCTLYIDLLQIWDNTPITLRILSVSDGDNRTHKRRSAARPTNKIAVTVAIPTVNALR